ncbi:AraC family transcriptional regulator [uncultured Kriegella sp.]|uniref:helix-turn-helix domain-containing protein n=1 Tax=uncultured Kriegella sp. TaxID=1798910 RepID=UPI0030DA3D68|tara:strand:- start:116778 stop:117761 length:984 start_codon:yes stop_codon:yes gene_type:complete
MSEINITVEGSNETSFDCGSNSRAVDECGTLEIHTKLHTEHAQGWYKELIFENFKVGFGFLNAKRQSIINFNFKGQTIEMIFVLKGSFVIDILDAEHTYNFEPNKHNILFYTNSSGRTILERGDVYIFLVNLSPHFFGQFLPNENEFIDFVALMQKSRMGQFQKYNCPITPKLGFLIHEIIDSNWQGHYRKMHINARVLELLLLQLDQFKSDAETKIRKGLTKNEEEKIYRAQEYILKHYKRPLTLQSLSQKVGTNEFTLKKGFKSIFGTTVFRYITDLKMDRAKNLLIERQLTVGQVSEIVGYKNPQHFSTAFKKKYGITPGKMRS